MAEKEKMIFDILRGINGRMNEATQELLAPLGITMPQAMILVSIHENDGMRITELADRLKTTCANCSTICQRLEKAELLVRNRNEKDQRVVHLSLTPKAQDMIESIYNKINEIEELFFLQASEEEKSVILDGLKILYDHMNKVKGKMLLK